MFFNTGAPVGANLYACTATNTWSVQGGITGSNCWADSTSHTLRCQDPGGNVYTVVETATSATANQWVDYIGANGVPHTSQPTAAAAGAVADPGSNSIPYRSGAGTATAANAIQLSGPFFCQDSGSTGAYTCNLTPAIASYTTGTIFWFRANTANTGSATLNLNGLGAKAIMKQANQPLAANDIRSGEWVMVTFDGTNLQMQSQPGNAVSSVFGRSGAVAAQTGDYTFSQIGGTASAAQLPSTAMQTNQGNAVTAGTQDFSQAAHTLPMKSGSVSAMPLTCTVGESYFATDALAGSNLYGCTAANFWSQQAGGGSSSTLTVKTSGTTVGSRNTINIVPGTGMAPILTDTGSQINIQIPIDTTVTDTRLNAASGGDLLVTPVSNSGTAYQGCPSGLTPPITSGMVVHLVPDHASTGGATTFNYCGTSAIALMEADGLTNLTATDLSVGRQADIWYDGTNAKWRLKVPSALGSAAVSMVFGRAGAVVATSGDYTAAQVTNAFDVTAVNTVTDNSAPSTPASGKISVWADSINKVVQMKNDAGTVAVMVVPNTGTPNNFVTGVSSAGAVSTAQPSCSSLSNAGSGCSATLAAVATSGSAADLSAGTLAAARLPVFPDVKYSPAANCNNTAGGNGWSVGAGGTVTCRAGTNNSGGYISITDTASTFAQFTIAVPEDWAGGSNYPYIRFYVSSGDITNGHAIIPQIKTSCQKGDGSTTDDVTFNAAHAASTITVNATANQFWSTSAVQLNATDFTGCAAGSLMIVQVGRASDTATSAAFYGASVTIPRVLTIQAN
jgi:hypothetical protein